MTYWISCPFIPGPKVVTISDTYCISNAYLNLSGYHGPVIYMLKIIYPSQMYSLLEMEWL